MRNKVFMCVVILAAMFSQAETKVQSFGHFIVNVPSGWHGELQGATLIVKSENYNASVAVAFAEMGEASLTDIVERLYIQMNGESLQQDSDGDYSFMFKNLAGAESFAIITGSDGYYMVLSVTGYDIEALHSDFEAIMDSVDWED